MAQKIILKCDKCGKNFELTAGHLKSTAGVIADDEMAKRDGVRAKEFVGEVLGHRPVDCDGKIYLESTAFVD